MKYNKIGIYCIIDYNLVYNKIGIYNMQSVLFMYYMLVYVCMIMGKE